MKRFILLPLIALLLSCGDDEPTKPDAGDTKSFAIDVNDKIPCSEANGQYLCQQLGYQDCIDYNCVNPDNTGVYIYEVVCWRP